MDKTKTNKNSFLPKGYKIPKIKNQNEYDWRDGYCDKIQDDEFTLGEQRGANITFGEHYNDSK